MFSPRVLLAAVLIFAVLMPSQFALAEQATPAVRAAAGASSAPASGAAVSATTQLLIGFVPGTPAAARAAAVARRGGQIIRTFENINAMLIEVPTGRAGASDFSADTTVRYAEPNAPVYPVRIPAAPNYMLTPNDPGYSSGDLWGPGKIAAPTAWDTTTGGSGVVVAVVDSGIDYTHPDLAANVWTAPPGWDVDGCGPGTHGYRVDSPSTTNCDPVDQYGHGTHVAGTIGAVGDNGQGSTGVDWRVTLMPLRFMAANGAGDTAGAIAAIDYAVQAKQRGVNVRVLNLSWTTLGVYSALLYAELKVASDNGILIVAAAGNNGTDNATTPTYPSNFATHDVSDPFPDAIPGMIAVAASDRSDNLASFDGSSSNYSAARVQLAAPGVDIYSTIPGYNTTLLGETKNYATLSGTSMATPHVSGAAALLLSVPGFRDLTAAQLRDRLLRCADATSGLSGKVTNGRLDVARALRGDGGCATAPTFALTLNAGSGGTIVPNAPGPYAIGTTVAISAQPQAGYGLVGWTIDGVANASLSNPYTLRMDAPHIIAARFAPDNSGLTVNSLAPATIPAGSTSFVLTINGSGFAPGAVVKWAGTPLATSVLGATQLQAIVPDTLVANAGPVGVEVSNPGSGGGPGTATFTVGAAEPPIGFDQLPSRQLSDPPFVVTASATGASLKFFASGGCTVGATTVADSTATATVTLTAPGDCAVTATQAGGSTTRSFAVTEGVPTITWAAPATIVYGTALDATILNATAQVPGNFNYSPAVGTVLPAGAHTLAVTFTPADTTRYASITRTVALTVTQAPLNVTANVPAAVYGQPLPPFAATYSGLVNGETAQTALDGVLTFATNATDRSPAGVYVVTPGGLTAANYALTFTATNLTIAPAPLTVTANDWARPTNVADPAFSVSYGGFIPGEDRQALGGELACTSTATATSPPGTYTITCGGLSAANYAIAYRPGTLTIVDAGATLNVPPVSATVGQQSATLVALVAAQPGAAPSGSVTFTVKQGTFAIGDAVSGTLVDGEASVSFPLSALAAGDYTIVAHTEATGNVPAADATGALTVARRSQAITFVAPTAQRYGDTTGVLTATASSGLAVAFAADAGGPCTVDGTSVQFDRAGICTITATQAGDVATLPATAIVRSFMIARGASALAWDAPASITYGTPLGAAQLAADPDNAGSIAYDPPLGAILDAGTHTLTAYFTPTAGDTFAASSKSVTITVVPAPLTLTALNATALYAAPLPPLAVEARGLVNGDTATGLGLGATPPASAAGPLAVGTYSLTPVAPGGGNYAITTSPGTLTVLPRPLTLTATDATRASGASDPAFGFRYDGFAAGESAASLGLTPTCATSATSGALPGTYPIVCSLTAPTNYRPRSVPGVLTVTSAPQMLTFAVPADRMLSATTIALAATVSSGLPATFFVAQGSPCAVAGTTLTMLSVGPCVIVARQGGDARYAAAPEVARTMQILPLPAPPPPSPTPTPVPPPTATPVPPPPTVAPTPNPCPQTSAVTVARGIGSVSPAAVCLGVPTVVAAYPGSGQIFIGWAIDGVVQSYTNPVQLTLPGGHAATALFGPVQDFPDLPASPTKDAVNQLAARGIVKGYADGSFGPNDTTLRAQMAALIARSMGWDAEDHGNPFPDRGPVDDALWRNVGTLAYYGVARGYSDGTYNPTASVLRAQVISFIARAMVKKGYWQFQPDNPALYTNVPATSGHRIDLATYVRYVGAIPDVGAGGNFADWDQAATRGWFARTLWVVLQTQFSRSTLP